MEHVLLLRNRITKRKAKSQFKPSSEICFQNVHHQIKN